MCGAAVMIIAYFAIKSDTEKANTALLAAGISLLVVSLVIMFIGYRIAFVAGKGQKGDWAKYRSYPQGDIEDYQKELEEIRSKFAGDGNPQENVFPKRYFTGSGPLYDFNVIKNGKIYYAYLVEAANAILTNKNLASSVMPAVVVYSTDEYYEKNPLALREIVKKIYTDMRDDSEWYINEKVKDDSEEGRELILSSVMVYRNHLPTGYLSDALIPIVANPDKSTSVFVVDFKYWTDNFIGNFANRRFMKTKIGIANPSEKQ